MRLLAISVMILAGTLGAGIGVIAESLPGARYRNNLDTCGMWLAGIGLVLFVTEVPLSGVPESVLRWRKSSIK
jgi:hypothetical protein